VDTVTISGPFETTTKFIEELKAKGIFARDVKSSNVAYHSYYMNDIAPQLKAALVKVLCHVVLGTRLCHVFLDM
jgi:fatty acid synthase